MRVIILLFNSYGCRSKHCQLLFNFLLCDRIPFSRMSLHHPQDEFGGCRSPQVSWTPYLSFLSLNMSLAISPPEWPHLPLSDSIYVCQPLFNFLLCDRLSFARMSLHHPRMNLEAVDHHKFHGLLICPSFHSACPWLYRHQIDLTFLWVTWSMYV